MKKYIGFIIVILLSGVLLFSCSNSEEKARDFEEEKSTSNPMEIITDDSYNIFNLDGNMELEIIDRYTSDEAEAEGNGLVTLDKNGFIVRFGLIHVYNPIVKDESIYILGERENTNKDGGIMGIPDSVISLNGRTLLGPQFLNPVAAK